MHHCQLCKFLLLNILLLMKLSVDSRFNISIQNALHCNIAFLFTTVSTCDRKCGFGGLRVLSTVFLPVPCHSFSFSAKKYVFVNELLCVQKCPF